MENIENNRLVNNIYYGQQTLSAIDNFRLENKKTNMELIYAMVIVKKAVAKTYIKLDINKDIYQAIDVACDYILKGKYNDFFVVEALQGGAGTSTNMNVNEVIASAALDIIGEDIHKYDIIHPLDDVNKGQSTNDVYPTLLELHVLSNLEY